VRQELMVFCLRNSRNLLLMLSTVLGFLLLLAAGHHMSAKIGTNAPPDPWSSASSSHRQNQCATLRRVSATSNVFHNLSPRRGCLLQCERETVYEYQSRRMTKPGGWMACRLPGLFSHRQQQLDPRALPLSLSNAS
jgi:hypothetical protein